MAMCPCHGLMYVGHGEVALPSLLVDPVEATVVLPELPPQLSPLLLFLLPLPPLWLLLFFVPIVVIVRRSRQRGRLRLRSQRRSAGVERRRSNGRPNGVQVDLLQKEVIANFKKVRERRGAPDDGLEVLKALIKAAKDVEDEDPVINERPQVG
jgi:hypothetical protein